MFKINELLNNSIKENLIKLNFKKNLAPKGLRRWNQFQKYFNNNEIKYLNSFLKKYQNEKLKINFFTFFWLILNNKLNDFIENKIVCEICNKPVKYLSFKEGFAKTCSTKCLKEYKKKAFDRALEKYKNKNNINENVQNFSQLPIIKEKRSQWFKSQEFKEKVKKYNINKYGVDNPFKLKEFQDKIKKTNLIIYGVENPMKSDKVKKKLLRTLRSKNFKKNLEIAKKMNIEFNRYEYLNKKEFSIKCLKCCYSFISDKIQFCPNCFEYHITKPHKYIENILKELNIKYQNNKRFNINNKILELDIFIPEFNLGIEINGTYWHSTIFRDKKHNFLKKEFFLKKNINVLFFWDIDIINPVKFEIIKSIIKSKLNFNKRIFARKCQIKKISSQEVFNFFEENHLQGGLRSSYNYGLFYNNELISAVSFGQSRFTKKSEVELYRFSNKKNINIVGGASKLFKFAMNDLKTKINLNKIITFADYDIVNKFENIYLKLDFKLINYNESFFYAKNSKKFHRYQLQKHRLKKLEEFKDIFDDNYTAEELLKLKKYLKCYTCGQLKFEKEIE